MNIHACSVAFRHSSPTASELSGYIRQHGFDGIEIWAPHAREMADDWAALPERPDVAMLSGYLPLGTIDFYPSAARELVDLTSRWQAPKLRLFAGQMGWDQASVADRAAIIRDLRLVADMAQDQGLQIAIETHPGTLADSLTATCDLMQMLNHRAIGLNFDVLHVWEGGTDPVDALDRLAPYLCHVHLKNVTTRDRLTVFAPGNVHDADGDRTGMCRLFDGVLDYNRILPALPQRLDMSLEWFGPDPAKVMAGDLAVIRRTANRKAA
jgi:3-dehydroshikimate dehydratase